jgi:hypothetical protein
MDREREKESKRNRRNTRENKVKYAKEVFGSWTCIKDKEKHDKWVEKMSKTQADNMKSCSCSMCCNRRNSPYNKGNGKLTMQERRKLEADKDEE